MRAGASWGVVVLVGIAYPLTVLAGGFPRFPSRDECVLPAVAGQQIEAVFGYFGSEHEATMLRSRALKLGFQGTDTERDACGRVKVVIRGIPTLAVGRAFAREARGAGFSVTLERAG